MSTQHLRDARIRSVVVGLGFEERTRMSAERMFSVLKPETAVLVRYAERGFGAEIEALAEAGADRRSGTMAAVGAEPRPHGSGRLFVPSNDHAFDQVQGPAGAA